MVVLIDEAIWPNHGTVWGHLVSDSSLDELHAQFDGTSCAGVAEFADWLASDTGICFLDFTDELDVLDDEEWDPAYLADLAAQWCLAEGIRGRIDALCARLEGAPAARFAALVAAALEPHAGGQSPDA